MNLKSLSSSSKLLGVTRSDKDKYIEKLDKLTRGKLLEVKERQEHLLANKNRVAKLPDKGKRIQDFYDKILKELATRDEIENAANLFSALNIATTGKEKLNNLEWTGDCNTGNVTEFIDSDDEETDPIRILAKSKQIHKQIIELKPDPSIITEEDLNEIESFKIEDNDVTTESNQSIELEPHAIYLMSKSNETKPLKEKFMPYRTTKSDVHSFEKEKLRKVHTYWENTAATPPANLHSGTKLLNLQDSIDIQNRYKIKLKALQEQQATERLATKLIGKHPIQMSLPNDSIRLSSKAFNIYRPILKETVDSDDEDDDNNLNKIIENEDEVVDDDDDKGGVTFKIYD